MKLIKWLLGIAAVALLSLAGLYAYHLRNLDDISLLSCMETPPFPGSAWVCTEVLYAAHPTSDEVKALNELAGAVSLLSLPEEESRALLKHYVAAGLDVNAVDQRPRTRGWTSMHLAVSAHDVKAVRLLLEAGAKPELENGRKPTPREMVRLHLIKTPNDPALLEIQKLLSSAGPSRPLVDLKADFTEDSPRSASP